MFVVVQVNVFGSFKKKVDQYKRKQDGNHFLGIQKVGLSRNSNGIQITDHFASNLFSTILMSNQFGIQIPTVICYSDCRRLLQNDTDGKFCDDSIAVIDAGDEHTVIVTHLGRVFTCGSNDFGQVQRDVQRLNVPQLTTL